MVRLAAIAAARLAAVLCLALPPHAAAQEAPPPAAAPPGAEELLTRYRQLEAGRRGDVARNLERRLARTNDDLLQSIQSMQQGRGAFGGPGTVRWFEPREHAPGAAPRALVGARSERHRRMTHGMGPFVLLPHLAATVGYDWQQGAAVWHGAEPTDDQKVANLAHGFAPGADHAVARLLAALDRDPRARALGDYFEHLYADRDGGVFAGVTLYDAWRSGKKLEMPDTDAIAFAKLVLHTQAYVAPLPADRRRERLYEKVALAFAEHHAHRTLCQALAATFVTASPTLDPAWQTLVDRCHWIWQHHGRDVGAVAKWLQGFPDRSAVLQHVDDAIATDGEPVRQHRAAMAGLADWLRAELDAELQRAGG